jgi:hypothetical protein
MIAMLLPGVVFGAVAQLGRFFKAVAISGNHCTRCAIINARPEARRLKNIVV